MGDRGRRTGAIVVIAFAFAGSAGYGCTSNCTTMGCQPGATIVVNVDAPASSLAGSTLEVCRNDVCLSGDFRDISDAGQGIYAASLSMPNSSTRVASDPWASASVATTDAGVRIDIYYGSRDVAHGDSYHVRLVAATGETLADYEKTVTYEAFYPNGPDCDENPCWRVGITF
jgi:hypothetical protein